MKKVLLVLALMTVLWSCKKNDDQKEPLKQDVGTSKNKAQVRWAADGKWDLLGFGYDVTGDVLNAESASDAPIIDMVSFERDYLQRIGYSNTGSGSQDFYAGVSASDYLKDVIKKRSWGVKTSMDQDDAAKKKFYFSASISRNREDQHTTTYSSRYSYATFESFRAVKRIWFTQDVPPSLLMNYLTPEFVYNVATLDAMSLVRRYGTHVLLDITIGGKLRLDYSSVIAKESDYTKNQRTTTVGLAGGVKKILGISFDASVTNEEITKVNTESKSKQYTLKFFGGTNSGRTISFDSEGNTSESLNIASWEQSVTPTNSALVHVDNAIPIYEFIADPVKKSQVQAAVEQYLIDNQAKELGEVPIYEFYHDYNGDHVLSSNRQVVVPQYGGWAYHGVPFYAFPVQANGTVPIYEYYHDWEGDHYYTTNSNAVPLSQAGWHAHGIIYYAFSGPGLGRVPLYEYYHDGNSDHYYSINPNAVNVSPGNWVKHGIAFYVYPAH